MSDLPIIAVPLLVRLGIKTWTQSFCPEAGSLSTTEGSLTYSRNGRRDTARRYFFRHANSSFSSMKIYFKKKIFHQLFKTDFAKCAVPFLKLCLPPVIPIIPRKCLYLCLRCCLLGSQPQPTPGKRSGFPWLNPPLLSHVLWEIST